MTSEDIGAFHLLFKKKAQSRSEEERANIQSEIDSRGGLQQYQQISLLGEVSSKFDSSEWICKELSEKRAGQAIKLLDVGAIRVRYAKRDPRLPPGTVVNLTAIDLLSQQEGVVEADFFDFAPTCNQTYDAVSLSLVLNTVALPEQRGRMLQLAHTLANPDGLLFVILPQAAVSNSRYLKFKLLFQILRRAGFENANPDVHISEKLIFLCLRKTEPVIREFESPKMFRKTLVRGGPGRNNFAILLPESQATIEANRPKATTASTEKRSPTTSNQRKKARKRAARQQQQGLSPQQNICQPSGVVEKRKHKQIANLISPGNISLEREKSPARRRDKMNKQKTTKKRTQGIWPLRSKTSFN